MAADDGTPWGSLSEVERVRWRLTIPCDDLGRGNGCGAHVGEACVPVKESTLDVIGKDGDIVARLPLGGRLWCLRRRVLAKQAWYAAPSCYNCGVRQPEAELEDHEDGCGL